MSLVIFFFIKGGIDVFYSFLWSVNLCYFVKLISKLKLAVVFFYKFFLCIVL